MKTKLSKISPNRILLLVVCLILIVGLVVISLSTKKAAVTLDRTTPQGVVQAYVAAVLDGQTSDAVKYLAAESRCDVSDLDRIGVVDGETSRVDLLSTKINGDRAQVIVNAEVPFTAPFQSFMFEKHTLRLVQENGSWLLTGVPWPLYDCGVVAK